MHEHHGSTAIPLISKPFLWVETDGDDEYERGCELKLKLRRPSANPSHRVARLADQASSAQLENQNTFSILKETL